MNSPTPRSDESAKIRYEICALDKHHLDGVVKVHVAAFPDFFLTFLGPRFLREFYSSFTEGHEGVGLVAVDQDRDRVLGVVVGPLHPRGYFGRLLRRRWMQFALASIFALCKRPSIAPRLLRATHYRGERVEGPERSLLSSVAVSPSAQGSGVGRSLVLAWLAEVRRCGIRGACLSTDADSNDAANAFYRRLGWRLDATYATPEGRRMNRFTYDFSADE